jgi:GMP synthase (glutamine-hydrolysing)
MELTHEVVELLIAASEKELATLTGHRFVQQPNALRKNDYGYMNQQLFVFLDKLMSVYAVTRR